MKNWTHCVLSPRHTRCSLRVRPIAQSGGLHGVDPGWDSLWRTEAAEGPKPKASSERYIRILRSTALGESKGELAGSVLGGSESGQATWLYEFHNRCQLDHALNETHRASAYHFDHARTCQCWE